MNSFVLKRIFVVLIFTMVISICFLPAFNGANLKISKNQNWFDSIHPKHSKTSDYERNMNDLDDVIICLKKYDKVKGLIDEPIGSMTTEQAYQLKNDLTEIWQENRPVLNKIHKSIDLLERIDTLQVPLQQILKPLHSTRAVYPNSNVQDNRSSNQEVFNFVSLWGSFCFGQPNVYLFGGDITMYQWIVREYPEGDGYNSSFFGEYGIGALMFPFLGWGFFGTAGLFGVVTLQNSMFNSPTTFFAFIVGTLFVGLSFKIGNPYLSIFELYFGGAGIPFAIKV